MWLILQQGKPDDYVLEAHLVREFVEKAFAHVGRTIVWHGRGVEEKGFEKASGRVFVEIDPRYFRPTEVDALIGDPSKARANLGWSHDQDVPYPVGLLHVFAMDVPAGAHSARVRVCEF
jgi:GDPmannose 4,6-dehydratase